NLKLLFRLALGTRTPSIAQRDPPNIQPALPPPPPLNSFGRTPATSVLGDLTNGVNSSLPPPAVSSVAAAA
ncbi:unnamed protein product, partial [Rotaria magnacalcarata]